MQEQDNNKALLIRFLDAFSNGDIAAAAACFDAERYYSHGYEADLAGTWEQQKARRRAGAWSDVSTERHVVWAEGDRVGHHSSFTGTHSGEFLGIPPSGNRITMPMIETWRVADGKIVEHWGGFVVTAHTMDRLRGTKV